MRPGGKDKRKGAFDGDKDPEKKNLPRHGPPVTGATTATPDGTKRQSGAQGLPTLGRDQPPPSLPPSTPNEIETMKKIIDGLVALARPEARGTARGMGQDLLAGIRKNYNAAQTQNGNISLANLRRVVAEEVKAAVNGAQDRRSWATVAAAAPQGPTPTQTQHGTPSKIVPAR